MKCLLRLSLTLVSTTASYRLLDTQTRARLPRALVFITKKIACAYVHACFTRGSGRTTFILLPTPLDSLTAMASSKEMSGGSHHKLLYHAVSLVLKDEGFSLPSLPAWRAQEAAEKFLEWGCSSENKPAWKVFAETYL